MTGNLIVLLAKLISGAQPRWEGCGPDTRQRIYFANHMSHLDALVLWSVLPKEVRVLTRPVAARDYWEEGRIRRYVADKVFRAILIERERPTVNNNPVTQILEEIGERESIILFPEGGRFSGPEPVPFKSGLYHLARKRPEIELIPVLIDNMNRILPKGEVLPVPVMSSVTFGAPMELREGEGKTEFLERARQEVMNLRHPCN